MSEKFHIFSYVFINSSDENLALNILEIMKRFVQIASLLLDSSIKAIT